MKKTKVIINSVTVKDDSGTDLKLIIKWEKEEENRDNIPEMSLTARRDILSSVSLDVGQAIQVWGGWTTSTDIKLLDGYIEKYSPEGGMIKITAKSKSWDLVRKNVNKVYDSSIDLSAGEVSEIAEDLIETYGGLTASVQASGVEDGRRIDVFKCIHTDIFERLNVLAKALNWQIWYDDANDLVHFEPQGYTASGITLTVGSEILEIPRWNYDTTNMINDLRVDGATTETDITESGQVGVTAGFTTASITLTKTPNIIELIMDASSPPTTQREGGTIDSTSGHFYYVDRENKKVVPAAGTAFTTNHYAIINYSWSAPAPIHMINAFSITSYRRFDKQINLTDIASVADAESRAANILAMRSLPFVSADLKVKTASANLPNLGSTVTIIDSKSNPSVNNLFVVTRRKLIYPSAFEEVTIGDSELRLADWQDLTEDRLKRLEEQFIRNQDLLLELVNINNDDEITNNVRELSPRYVKLVSQDIRNASNVYSFVLSHPSGGVLGTNLLGDRRQAEVTRFVQQHGNLCTEEFIDTDFKDASTTTAAWGTSGSITFTAGQLAQSLSVDYNNGTVTAATLTAAAVSGTFTYQLSANGGSSWETAASGTAHTFSSTGTDLRWKATENAAGTGEISQVIITSYH